MTSIKIVRRNGMVAFEPDGLQPGDPFEVDRGESVTWNNSTNEPHWPWPIDAQGNILSEDEALDRKLFLSDEIPPHQVSDPIFDVNPDFSPREPTPKVPMPSSVPPPKINCVCRLHRQERGCIVVRKS